MTTEFSALLPVIIIAAIVLVAAIWLLLRANRKTTIIDEGIRARDVLDEGAERASRNQALIDAAPAVVKPVPTPVAAPVAAVTPPAPAPAPAPASAAADDLSRIKGLIAESRYGDWHVLDRLFATLRRDDDLAFTGCRPLILALGCLCECQRRTQRRRDRDRRQSSSQNFHVCSLVPPRLGSTVDLRASRCWAR